MTSPCTNDIASRARRGVLCAAAAWAARAGAQPAQAAEATARPRGPLVWRGWDQTDIDDGFDVVKASPNIAQVTRRWASNSEQARTLVGPPQRLAYGPSPIEALDLFTTERANAPILAFVHGGGFNLERAANFAFAAETFVRAGAHLAVVDFGRAKDFGGDIVPLIEQVRRAVAWLHGHAGSFSGDPGRVYLCGHSSGAELVAQMLVTDWAGEHRMPRDTIKGALCCSAPYDMRALRLSRFAAGLQITDELETQFDIARRADLLSSRLIVAHGSLDTPLFRSGSRRLVDELQAAGKPARLLVAEGYNHFEVIETLGNPYGALGRAMLELMGLSTAPRH